MTLDLSCSIIVKLCLIKVSEYYSFRIILYAQSLQWYDGTGLQADTGL